jgi:hypothetical protein
MGSDPFRRAWPAALSGQDVDQVNGEHPILVDVLGAAAIGAVGEGVQRGVMLDIGGRLNKRPERAEVRFLLAPGQVDELIEALVHARRVADA